MKRTIMTLVLALGLAACGGNNSGGSPTPTRVVQVAVTPTSAIPATLPPKPATVAPVPAVVATKSYLAFLGTICGAFAARNTQALTAALPYFQYNSGLRYGLLGDGEGSTGDPSLFNTWLSGANIRCRFYTPDRAGHATVLTDGWTQNGGWALVDLDTFNGIWKINDFTFGNQPSLYQAMQTAHPVVVFH